MKVGITILPEYGRISPMFEVAEHLAVVRFCHGEIIPVAEMALPINENERVSLLTDLGIRMVFCGAIANETKELLSSQGIEVLPFLSGKWQEVVKAWFAEPKQAEKFLMPGCCHHRKCCKSKIIRR